MGKIKLLFFHPLLHIAILSFSPIPVFPLTARALISIEGATVATHCKTQSVILLYVWHHSDGVSIPLS